jgi:hypothetical protein
MGCVQGWQGWFLPEWFLVAFAQKPLLRHKLVKWFLSSIVVFAIYLRPRAIYLALSAASEQNFSAFAFVHTVQSEGTVSARPSSKSWFTYEQTTFNSQSSKCDGCIQQRR